MSVDIKYGRKKSGIRKELNKKVSNWIDSIDDENIQKLCRKNTIVTGGSIASMLLGDPVNDYDIYFKTKDCNIQVAKYYINKLNSIRVSNKLDEVPMNVIEKSICNIKGVDEDRVYIEARGGKGIVTNETDSDDFGDFVTDENGKYAPVFISSNAITLTDKIQLVTRFYGDPQTIHSNYDFVHAMNYYDYDNDTLVLHPEALECLLSRTLVYKGSLYPIASIFRTKKFLERGWRISAGEQLKIMWQISEIDMSDINVLTEQLTGVDQAYMYALVDILQDSKKEDINSTYVAKIIDKLFD